MSLLKQALFLSVMATSGCTTPHVVQKIDMEKPEAKNGLNYAKKLSSGYVGCDPKKITIKNYEVEGTYQEAVQTWQAICNNEVFYCSLAEGSRYTTNGLGTFQYTSCTKGNN